MTKNNVKIMPLFILKRWPEVGDDDPSIKEFFDEMSKTVPKIQPMLSRSLRKRAKTEVD